MFDQSSEGTPHSCFSICGSPCDGKSVCPQSYRSWAFCAAFITRCLAPCHFPSPLLLIEIDTSYEALAPNCTALIRASLSVFPFHKGLDFYLFGFFLPLLTVACLQRCCAAPSVKPSKFHLFLLNINPKYMEIDSTCIFHLHFI